ncbi:MAG: cob(I)yrinic acid a,c-diamide adenosyltransferase [Trueperaceae bacterium]|nr:cob(I)yrinic acid a,c-diamide adenosyltransferase [Trueperaceae bacterium]
MKIYTKTGDRGETALYGGQRVAKDDARVSAYGTVDEANAAVGMARAALQTDQTETDQTDLQTDLDATLAHLQNALFDVGADLATPLDSRYRANIAAIDEADIRHLEATIDRYEAGLEPLQAFILPGGHPASAALQLARATIRRAERETVALARHDQINPHVGVFLNRFSDLLFVLARAVNTNAGHSETRWHVKGRDRPE